MAKQTPIYVIFDGGNSLWKSVIFGDDIKRREIVIPHAIIEDEGGTRFQSVQSRFAGDLKNFDREWLKFGEQSFVVGNSAEAEGVVTRKTGSAKYTNDYYGVSLMAILLAAMPQGHNNIHVYASFPPGDNAYVRDLTDSILGKWSVETTAAVVVNYHIRSVQPYDEPLGGYICASCDPQGIPYKDSHLDKGSTLVVDVGGKVSSVMRVLQGGRVQYGNAKSIDIGIQDVVSLFTESLKRMHPELKGLRSFNDDIIRRALATGRYQFKGDELDCAESVRKATNTIINRLSTFYTNDFAGGANDNQILVTGGGGGALFHLLDEAFQHKRMFTAERPDAMHLANVRGGERICRLALLTARKAQS